MDNNLFDGEMNERREMRLFPHVYPHLGPNRSRGAYDDAHAERLARATAHSTNEQKERARLQNLANTLANS